MRRAELNQKAAYLATLAPATLNGDVLTLGFLLSIP
jgi:hypothetical protein